MLGKDPSRTESPQIERMSPHKNRGHPVSTLHFDWIDDYKND